MILPDVNVLIYAFRAEHPRHEEYRRWLEGAINGPQALGLADVVLSGFVRVVTHPRVFQNPDSVDVALSFVNQLRDSPNSVIIAPGERHWAIFVDLCHKSNAKGNLVADAFLAALAIESGSEWITTDRDFARFPGLKWRDPLS